MTGSNWRGMFEQSHGDGRPPAGVPPASPVRAELEDEGPALDLSVYRPWVLQRGRSRPAMMLDLRRYEPRSGMWTGWAVGYPHLVAVEYTGDRLVSLDFGARQFVLEGQGLGELVRHLQLGSVLAIHEFAPSVWPATSGTAVISAIRKVEREAMD